VAGLATVTPAAGYVSTYSAIAIGVVAGLVCQWALKLKVFLRLDDALDVIAVHFTGGVIGTLLVGVFGEAAINRIGVDGALFGGGVGLLSRQALATVVVVVFSFCVSWLIATVVQRTMGLRVQPANEENLDQVQQGSSAYAFGRSSDIMQAGVATPAAAARAPQPVAAGQPMRLLTVLVDDPDVDELKGRLLAGGAVSIALSDASLYVPEAGEAHVRGSVRTIDFTPRLRMDVVVPQPAVAGLVAVLAGLEAVGDYVQVSDLDLVHAPLG
jgi:hypothetical protein